MISKSLNDTYALAKEHASRLEADNNHATVIALHGDLGAGKTTFTKAYAQHFDIDEKDITSPTFVIEKKFDIKSSAFFKKLIHIDAYRLEKPEDAARLNLGEIFSNPQNLIIIEWPEKLGKYLPGYAQKISFTGIDENTREIVFN